MVPFWYIIFSQYKLVHQNQEIGGAAIIQVRILNVWFAMQIIIDNCKELHQIAVNVWMDILRIVL